VTPNERTPLRFESADATLPDLPDLRLLREALVDASRVDEAQIWGGGARLSTIDKRLTALDEVAGRISAIADRVRRRTERVMVCVVAALRAVEEKDQAAASRHLVAAGEAEESYNRLDEARAYYEKALEVGRRPRDRRGEALALRRLARVARARGELDRALGLYRESREVADASRDMDGFVIGCLGAGHVLADLGRWDDARESYLRGVERVESEETAVFVHLCNGLSVVERRVGDFEASETWLARGEAVAPAAGDETAAAYLQHGRGKLYLAKGDPEAALTVFREALARPLDFAARIVTLLNLGEALRMAGRLPESEAATRRAEELAIAQGDLPHLPHVYIELGELARHRGDRDGFVFFEQALDVLRERELPSLDVALAQRSYARFEARFGEREAAIARFRIAEHIYRRIGSMREAEEVALEVEQLEAGPSDINEDQDGIQ
jgi:tetratricopeptide (TPR) repeat protein